MDIPELPINKDMTYIGQTTFRGRNQTFGIKRRDRRQHVYVLGKSGTGKSVLLSNMIVQNIQNGDGVCVVDPHGELVESVLQSIPPNRIKDVVYFNPADTDYHIGFNVIEILDPKYKHLVASGLMGIFTKIWANAWSARMEYILNNAILALLDTPGSTLLGIPRILVDKDYRQKIIANLKDPVIKAFWIHEYEAWNEKFRNEAIAPIQNKVGQFLSSSIIRNVVGQSLSTINVFDIMNEGKIFLVNVSKGRIGEDNSALLGGMIITKIQLAAMERVRIPEDERKDFYLYVDEFQNFVTDSFASILSEARKYRLNLTVAHQYTAQLAIDGSTAVRDAVFGNVGTMIIFRVGSDDAQFLENEFEPEFTPQDIVNLPNYRIYLRLMIDGVTSRPFSARTLPPIVKNPDPKIEEEVIKTSRALYCKSKEDVEQEINSWSGISIGNMGSSSESGGVGKFAANCSSCQKETTVPFKPEPGRPVYCKDCVTKIKAGEMKPVKLMPNLNQPKFDEGKFFKPLSDLGIEFEDKDQGISNIKIQPPKPSIFSAIKKVFTPAPHSATPIKTAQTFAAPTKTEFKAAPSRVIPSPVVRTTPPVQVKVTENSALKAILNKALTEKIPNTPHPNPLLSKEREKSEPVPISLSSLKQTPTPFSNNPGLKDRGASEEDKNKLKEFMKKVMQEIPVPKTPEVVAPKVEIKKEIPIPVPQPKVEPAHPHEGAGGEQKPEPKETPIPTPPIKTKEVPEDVLRKILEE